MTDGAGSPAPPPSAEEGGNGSDDGALYAYEEPPPLSPAQLVGALRAGRLDAKLHARSLARLTFAPPAMRKSPPEPHALFERLQPFGASSSATL